MTMSGSTKLFAALMLACPLLAPAQTAENAWMQQQRAAVEKSENIVAGVDKMRGLLQQYLTMLAAKHSDTSKAFQVIFGQYLSWYQTFVGDYEGARKSFSIADVASSDDSPSPLTGGWKPEPAADVIARLAKGHKAVFFNEGHSAPVTRSLTVQMLPKLRAEGFDTFAAETLYSTDRNLAGRGYPVDGTGYYTREPVLAEMVRTALKLGFRIIPYEAESDATGDAREAEQARNLYERAFKQHPDARLVVDAGYGHIQKTGKYLNGVSMATHFIRISHIDPLCIEQVMLIDHLDPAENHPIYTAVLAALHPQQPIAFVDAQGNPWSLKAKGYDASVFFPATVIRNNRPTWLALGGLRMPYPVGSEFCRNKLPCLVEARYPGEGDDAIPADRVVLGLLPPGASIDEKLQTQYSITNIDLYLKPGKYRLVAVTATDGAINAANITVSPPRTGRAP